MHVFSKSTSAALRYMVEEERRPESYLTTSWFLEKMDHWFDLMSSRNVVCALSHFKMEEYEKAISFLRDSIHLFRGLKIGRQGLETSPDWTGDGHNNNSGGQFLSTTHTGSYLDDASDHLADFLDTQNSSCSASEVVRVEKLVDPSPPDMTKTESCVLYHLAGYIVKRVIGFSLCEECKCALVEKVTNTAMAQLEREAMGLESNLPSCHELKKKILSTYIRLRLRIQSNCIRAERKDRQERGIARDVVHVSAVRLTPRSLLPRCPPGASSLSAGRFLPRCSSFSRSCQDRRERGIARDVVHVSAVRLTPRSLPPRCRPVFHSTCFRLSVRRLLLSTWRFLPRCSSFSRLRLSGGPAEVSSNKRERDTTSWCSGSGLRGRLAPSLALLVSALEEAAEPDYSWRAELMIHLVECLVDAGRREDACRYSTVTSEFVASHAPHLYPEVLTLMARYQLLGDSSPDMTTHAPIGAVLTKIIKLKNVVSSQRGGCCGTQKRFSVCGLNTQ
ncbi:unnamed protein product [Boreogadus saida]